MSEPVPSAAIDQLFVQARSHNGWTSEPVTDAQLQRIYEIARQGPTAFNCCPARFVFVRTPEGKERLKPALIASNVAKAMSAPVVAIVAIDTQWFELMPELFPAYDVAGMFRANAALAETTALRNGSFQGAYLMLAARAMGLDCGPMSGFDAAVLDQAFFPDGRWKSNFLCAIGHGEASALRPLGVRLAFERACQWA
jgi:3-hydroxypropanoate dehydrogenase